MKIIRLLLLLFFTAAQLSSAHSQPSTIRFSGSVFDSELNPNESESPVFRAKVELRLKDASLIVSTVYTNEKGIFTSEVDFKRGEYDAIVSKIGYETLTTSGVTVTGSRDTYSFKPIKLKKVSAPQTYNFRFSR